MKLMVYTDGSNTYNGHNYSYGGYGWVIVLVHNGEEHVIEGGGSMPVDLSKPVTNNRAELLAIITALEYVYDNSLFEGIDRIDLYSDSQICVNCINGKWRIKKNTDLFARYFMIQKKLKAECPIEIKWIKGHVGHKYNELADDLAGEYAARVRQPKPIEEVVIL